jgi:hypothetical protein
VGCGVVFRESRSSKTCLLLPIKQGGCWGTSGRVAGQAGRVAACGRGVENTCVCDINNSIWKMLFEHVLLMVCSASESDASWVNMSRNHSLYKIKPSV